MKSLKNILASALVAASTILPAKAADIPKPYVQTTAVSDFVSPSGAVLHERASQDWASIGGKGFEFGVWQNQFDGESGIAERDYCATYSFPISSNLTGSIGFQYWDYPNKRFGDNDSVETAGLNYSGKINASLSYTHLNEKSDVTESGERLHLAISKPFKILEGKTKLSLTPSLATALLDNYYGYDGNSQATAGLDLGVSRGNWNAHLFLNSQRGLTKEMETFNWGGASVGYKF